MKMVCKALEKSNTIHPEIMKFRLLQNIAFCNTLYAKTWLSWLPSATSDSKVGPKNRLRKMVFFILVPNILSKSVPEIVAKSVEICF